MRNLSQGFEFICSDIYDLLILTKWDWTDHVKKLELNLNKPKESDIKYNIENYFVRRTEMEYLGFWITHNGVKNINKK